MKTARVDYPATVILRELKARAGKYILYLAKGEAAWNPACTTCFLRGPTAIEYRQYSDGGVDAFTSHK